MSKLFKLKKWLTIPETEKYLTQLFGEEVTEADILRLALDGELTLSVNLVNGAYASQVNLTRELDVSAHNSIARDTINSMESLPNGILNLSNGLKIKKFTSEADDLLAVCWNVVNLNSKYYLIEETQKITGIFDLPMIDKETSYIEGEYQRLIKGVKVHQNLGESVFISKGDTIYLLQDDLDLWKDISGTLANANIDEYEIHGLENAKPDEKWWENRNKLYDIWSENPDLKYFPASDFPKNSLLVVRTESLRKLQDRLTKDDLPDKSEKPLAPRQRNTLLTIINALCEHSNIDIKSRGTAAQIARMTEEMGTPVSQQTILDLLKEIPDAVETRMK